MWCGDDESIRIDDLRAVDAQVRFLSIEPLLEDLGELDLTGIDWVIIGGESGPGARPLRMEWAQSVLMSVPERFGPWVMESYRFKLRSLLSHLCGE